MSSEFQTPSSRRVDLASDPASCSLTTHHHIYHINTDTQHACSCRVDLACVNSRPTSRSPTAAWQVVARAPAGRQAGVVISTARRYASSRSSCGPVSRCLSVCLSVTSRCSIETVVQIRLVFRSDALDLSCTVLQENSGICKNKGTSFWNFFPNS